MELIQVNDNKPMINGLAELNHHILDEHKEVRGGITGEGQELWEEDESGINEDAELVNDKWREAVQTQAHAQAGQGPQQQAQLPLVCWERFLPHRALKVLLVENDDSTRRIVCALLRNCGYEVVAVENGLEAWKILEDLTDQVDLILTEVIMPCLSGIGLLRKIMSHKTCKKIPVIMMSSRDSMSIILKCLSKGAVYFLVKPIRKNELQNLWQHVWRNFHSSSGSGSESGIMAQKSTKSKSAEESDEKSGSDDEDDIGSISLNDHDGSDNGSGGTQSSWTKKAVEVDSPKPMLPRDKLTDPRDSTCVQAILPRPKAFGNSWLPMTATGDCKEQDQELGKDIERGASRIPNWQLQDPTGKELNNIASINDEKLSETNPNKDDEQSKDDEQKDTKQLKLNSKTLNGDLRNQAGDPVGVITNSIHSPSGSRVFGISNGLLKVSGMKEKTIYENNEIPSLELSLKRQRGARDTESNLCERNILRHSDEHSAFSRYSSASTASQALTANVDSNSPVDNSSDAAKTESIQNFQSNPNGTPPSQQSNGSSNNNEIGLKTNSAFTKWTVYSDKPTQKSMIKCLHPSSEPVQNVHKSPQPTVHGKPDAAVANTITTQARGMEQQVQVQHHHHHYHHYHHHVRNVLQQQLANHDDLLLKTMVAAAPQFPSYNELSAPTEGNSSNHSLNGSTSGSNYGSNGQNWSSTAVDARGTNTEIDNKLIANSGAGGGIGYGSRSMVDQNRSAQRKVALNKFRQKRKERSFEKKVRYHSRKKLAEQRPRIRGQFVRRVVLENKDKDTKTNIP